jgi:hypothetical protein
VISNLKILSLIRRKNKSKLSILEYQKKPFLEELEEICSPSLEHITTSLHRFIMEEDMTKELISGL